MFTKGDILYADAHKYLRHKDRNEVALQLRASADDFTEVDMGDLNVSVSDGVVKFGTWFVVFPDSLKYGDVKRAVIQLRYSNDDQMALILNKDDSEDDAMLYQKMQEWREFASEIAKAVTE